MNECARTLNTVFALEATPKVQALGELQKKSR